MAELICIWSWCIYVLRGYAWASEAHPSFDAVRDWHQSRSLCHAQALPEAGVERSAMFEVEAAHAIPPATPLHTVRPGRAWAIELGNGQEDARVVLTNFWHGRNHDLRFQMHVHFQPPDRSKDLERAYFSLSFAPAPVLALYSVLSLVACRA